MHLKASFIGILLTFILAACLPSAGSDNQTGQSVDSNESSNGLKENSIINLYDAFGKDIPNLTQDFGFSCILKYKGKTILFDSGTNADIFKNNVEALGIDLKSIDFAVCSHAHFDHINGFDYLLEVNPDVKIYFPFDMYWGANIPFNLGGKEASIVDSLDKDMQYFGGDFESYQFNQSGRFWKGNIEFVSESTEIEPGIRLITTSSPYLGYFSKYPSLGNYHEKDDPSASGESANFSQLPEISLSLSTDEGQVVIVGCSHSTVETIIAETQSITQDDIALVYGGYHLLPYDRSTLHDLSVRLIDDYQVKKVAPTHCTGHLAFKILKDRFGDNYVFAGLGEQIAF